MWLHLKDGWCFSSPPTLFSSAFNYCYFLTFSLSLDLVTTLCICTHTAESCWTYPTRNWTLFSSPSHPLQPFKVFFLCYWNPNVCHHPSQRKTALHPFLVYSPGILVHSWVLSTIVGNPQQPLLVDAKISRCLETSAVFFILTPLCTSFQSFLWLGFEGGRTFGIEREKKNLRCLSQLSRTGPAGVCSRTPVSSVLGVTKSSEIAAYRLWQKVSEPTAPVRFSFWTWIRMRVPYTIQE